MNNLDGIFFMNLFSKKQLVLFISMFIFLLLPCRTTKGYTKLTSTQSNQYKINIVEEIRWGEIKYRLKVDLDKNRISKLYKLLDQDMYLTGMDTVIINDDTLKKVYDYRNSIPKFSRRSYGRPPSKRQILFEYKYLKSKKMVTVTKKPFHERYKVPEIDIKIDDTNRITIDYDSVKIEDYCRKLVKRIEKKNSDLLSIVFDGSIPMGLFKDIRTEINKARNEIMGRRTLILELPVEVNQAVVLQVKKESLILNNKMVTKENFIQQLKQQLLKWNTSCLFLRIDKVVSMKEFYEIQKELSLIKELIFDIHIN